MSSERATATRPSADLSVREPGRGLAGLIDVLDRAEGALPARRAAHRRASAHRPSTARSGAVRTVPLRSVRPAPMARTATGERPVPRVVVVPERPPVTGLADLVRRAAMWGAGDQGEYLAWRVSSPTAARRARGSRLRALVRRAALWGAGPRGEHLAWGGPAPSPVRDVDPPVVLRELPSTPTIQPVAPSPAAALLPRGPASSAGPRRMPPVPRGAVAVPGVRPCGPPEPSRATGWPVPAAASTAASGSARARGDPPPGSARGSPPPARRSRSPGSTWNSFP
ncbi:UNVERIFIED_ORG: hypothetical protein E4P37_20140 [Bacillus sp. AZ43]